VNNVLAVLRFLISARISSSHIHIWKWQIITRATQLNMLTKICTKHSIWT